MNLLHDKLKSIETIDVYYEQQLNCNVKQGFLWQNLIKGVK